jgi:hypothetical protein
MRSQCSIDDVVRSLKASISYKGDREFVGGVVASGLMSDVLTTDQEGILLVSNLTTAQVVRTADMVGAHAILITNKKPLSEDMIELAKDLSISLLRTDLSMFEACYHLGKLFYEG